MLGEDFELRQDVMPRPPRDAQQHGIPVASVRHLLDKHAATFKEQDWTDEEMPFTARLFKRPWRMVHNAAEGMRGHRSSFRMSTFGTRDHSGLETGLRIPPVRGQAVVYDPAGRDLLESEYLCVDDAIMNVAFGEYEQGGRMTDARLDRVAGWCQGYVKRNLVRY